MVTDGHNSLLGAQWKQLCRDRGIKQLTTEPYSHWQNLAEAGIRELKRLYRKISHNVPIPPRYWFYLLRYCCDICNRTTLDIHGLEGRTPYEKMYGDVPDIDAWTIFSYGEPVFYNFDRASMGSRDFLPNEEKMVGRWLGVCRNDATVRTYFVLTLTGSVIPRSDVIPLTKEERQNPKWLD